MEESYGKVPASHPDPESCVSGRKDAGEALTGAHAGQPLSCEIRPSGVPTPLSYAEGNTVGGVTGKPPSDPAQSETRLLPRRARAGLYPPGPEAMAGSSS